MSRFVPGAFIIEGEDDRKCELCGKIAECRPYGPNNAVVCFECGMKDEEGVIRRLQEKLITNVIDPAKASRN